VGVAAAQLDLAGPAKPLAHLLQYEPQGGPDIVQRRIHQPRIRGIKRELGLGTSVAQTGSRINQNVIRRLAIVELREIAEIIPGNPYAKRSLQRERYALPRPKITWIALAGAEPHNFLRKHFRSRIEHHGVLRFTRMIWHRAQRLEGSIFVN